MLQFQGRWYTGLNFLGAMIIPSAALADVPQPPCESPTTPAYAEVGAPPIVSTWSFAVLPEPWVPPECLQWRIRGFAVLVAVAGRIEGISEQSQLMKRLSAVSRMRNIRYWSSTRKKWRSLLTNSVALQAPDPAQRRSNFTISEMKPGKDLYSWQKENSPVSGVVFRTRIKEATKHKIVFEQVNMTASQMFSITVLDPHDYQTAFFLERESKIVWRFYSLTRYGKKNSFIGDSQLASIINRAIAFYRYMGAIPFEREPPAAP